MDARDIFIRSAAAADIDAVYAIEREGSNLWSRKLFMDEFGIDFSRFIVAETGGRVIGFAVAWIVDGELQLTNIGVSGMRRRNGIGTLLMNALTAQAHPKKIYIELKEKNNTAYHFYIMQGFRKTGIRKNYYADDNAVLMEKLLAP